MDAGDVEGKPEVQEAYELGKINCLIYLRKEYCL